MKTTPDKMAHYRVRGQEVLVDFDGTLCEFAYPKLGAPLPGALEFIKSLIVRGLRPVIWSSRMSLDTGSVEDVRLHRQAIIMWLKKHGFPGLAVDDGRSGKRLALAYVDDRGVAAGNDVCWSEVLRRVDEIHAREEAKWATYDEGEDHQ